MSQSQQVPRVTFYADEVSMDNGDGRCEEEAPLSAPQLGDEERGLIPRPPTALQPQLPLDLASHVLAGSGNPLFDGCPIFINAPQYHWHAHGAEGVDTQARDHLTALAEQLSNSAVAARTGSRSYGSACNNWLTKGRYGKC